LINLISDDCLSAMAKMDDGCIDLTVTSPPYDNLRTYKDSLEWGEHIWKPILEQLYRVTKEGGVVVWVVGDATIKGSETGTSLRQALYAMDCGFRLHDTMIYQTNKPPQTHNRYEQCWEYMFVLSRGKPSTWNPVMVKTENFGQKRTSTMRQDSEELGSRSAKGSVKEFKQKSNIWYLPRGARKDASKVKHPATFPDVLANDHIISWSNEGDTVFDPFMGSGTTGKMAKLNNRNFIGIEKVEEYFKIAQERISAT